MRTKFLFFVFLLLSVSIFAQEYPEVTIRDVNYASDEDLLFFGAQGSEPPPALVGDTVIVTGVVMTAPYRGANPDSAAMLHAGAQAVYLQDTSLTEWAGVLLRDPPAHPEFAILDTGLVIKVKAEVVEYFTTTELDIIEFSASDILGVMQRPKPVLLTLDSLFEKGTTNPNYLAEKWEGVYVEFRDVITTEQNVVGSGTFRIFDENNTSMVVYNKSDYYRNSFQAPLPGTSIKRIRGYIETRTGDQYGWFMINPVYFDDIEFGESPPSITGARRDSPMVGFGQDVIVTATVSDADETAAVEGVKLFYSVSDGPYTDVDMTLVDAENEVWEGVIPGQNEDAMVSYYIQSRDVEGWVGNDPSGAENNPYFYYVMETEPTIYDVQYSPYGSGYSAWQNYDVTVSGVVTADTTDIQGDGSNIGPQVYIQQGTGPWSGIQIFGTEADNLRRGDSVTVTGLVNESFGLTRIGTLDEGVSVTVVSTGNPIPEPFLISTADMSEYETAEPYEGVLVSVAGVTVIDENADGLPGPDDRNFGEMLVADRSAVTMRVELQDGTHDYHNYWDFLLEDQPIQITDEDTFENISGIMFYSFGNYKLVPRKNDDFTGHVVVSLDDLVSTPETYNISQNYPNPFNPSTKINFSLPEAGIVRLNVYNVLGEQVKTLVNEFRNVGNHTVDFNAADLTSGVYFYEISVNDFRSIRKMILIK